MLVPQTPISSRIRQSVNNAKYTFKIQIPLHHFFACGITLYKICFPLQLESEMVFRFMSQQVMRQQAFNHLFTQFHSWY